jgi:tight adherence protein C
VQLILAVMTGFSMTLFSVGLFRRNPSRRARRDARRRIEAFAGATPTPVLERPFGERVLTPVGDRISGMLLSALPQRIVASTRHRLEMAGHPASLAGFLTTWLALGIGTPVAVSVLLLSAGAQVGGRLLAALAVWALLGLYLPWLWLRRRGRGRAMRIQRELPDAIDLVITNLEAGLALQSALLAVAERMPGPVGEEWAQAVREISVGRDRQEALAAMAERTGVPDMRLFARAVAQAEQTGIPIARVLRNHAAESRDRRRQRAREEAAKVPVKITLPTGLFIFPTLLILVLAPVVIHVMDMLG